jgi:hypothetical protein
MQIDLFLQKLNNSPEQVQFSDTMATVEANYDFSPCSFYNGDLHNAANQNSGSCKLFAFAQLHALTTEQTLACFGHFYRDDVLPHPEGQDHQNIRNFIRYGWDGITFSENPLKPRHN